MTVDTTVKSQTRAELRPGWRVVRFDAMAENVNDRVDDPAEAGVEYYVGLEHLEPESLKIRRWGKPTDVEATKLRFKPGDIIFGRRRAYQRKLAVAEFEGICSAHAMVLRAREQVVLPEFLPFFMQSDIFFERAMSISVGSLSPTINWKTLAAQEFALPPRDEQRRIAEILWAADEASESYYEVVQQLESFLKVAFEEYISRSERILEKDVWTTLDDAIVDIVAGKSPSGSSVPALANEYGVLKVSAVGERGFVEEENKALLNQQDFNPDFEVKPHFLLVTRANALLSGVGRACIVHETRPGLMLSDKTLRLVVNTELTSNRFLLQSLRSPRARRHIELSLNGTDAKNISQEKLRETPIPLPPKNLQDEICRFLINQDRAIAATTRQIGQHRRLKMCLLEQLLLGQEV